MSARDEFPHADEWLLGQGCAPALLARDLERAFDEIDRLRGVEQDLLSEVRGLHEALRKETALRQSGPALLTHPCGQSWVPLTSRKHRMRETTK